MCCNNSNNREKGLETCVQIEGLGVGVVRDTTGPMTGSDQTGPLQSGFRSEKLRNSIFGLVPGWTGGPTDRTGGPSLRNFFYFFPEIFNTVVPFGTGRLCRIATQRPVANLVLVP